VAVSGGQGKKPTQSPAARVTAVTLVVKELPGPAPCGRKLEVKGDVTVDGPATIWYRFQANTIGLQFANDPEGTITLDAAGSTGMAVDVTFPASKAGDLRLHAGVQGPDGRRLVAKVSNVVPFRVACGPTPPRK
jgi:hypothetical protein